MQSQNSIDNNSTKFNRLESQMSQLINIVSNLVTRTETIEKRIQNQLNKIK